MASFDTKYSAFKEKVKDGDASFGFDIDTLARVEPVLALLYKLWWRIQSKGFDRLPSDGPAMIVGNSSGLMPWAHLMLIYKLMSDENSPRRVNVLCDLDWIEDQRVYNLLTELGFVPWSADNAKRLFAKNELVAVFPEGPGALTKTVRMTNRVCEFDWTKFLPAVEAGVKIYPLSILGIDEAAPVFHNSETLAKILNVKAFPISPFFPWLPFPFNLGTLPVEWRMTLLKPNDYEPAETREDIQEVAKQQAFFCEGDVQAEINRALKVKHRGN
jgi:1-acyl-sn-glycerol-3-phosphate acyltransferase